MQERESSRPVDVTARERAHPAIRKLARAAIALGRAAGAAIPPTAVRSEGTSTGEVSPTARQEGARD